MKSVYNVLMQLSGPVLGLLGVFSPKMKAFMQGRKGLFERLAKQMDGKTQVVWMHCASLGEYEQGLPVLEALRAEYPKITLVVSFFSPSGYEVKHMTAKADIVTYLPLDTAANAKHFLDIVKPELVLFVKYEVWPNFFFEIEKRNIPNLLISALFREDQVFFKSRGKLLRSALGTLDWIFVQNKSSLSLLQKEGFDHCSLSGDTRFDRVSRQIEQDNNLDFMDTFCQAKTTLIIGSSWPEDEALFTDYLKTSGVALKTVIAPHSMNEKLIEKLHASLGEIACRYSSANKDELIKARVLILDAVGFLSKVYSYGHIAYIGGGMGNSGLHNILEAATFGLPILIGKNYTDFPEAVKLREIAGLYSVSTAEEFKQMTDKLLTDVNFRDQTGMISGHYVNSNTGATKKILEYIGESHRDRLV